MLRRALESLLEISHASSASEIIVVDNASLDGTRSIIEEIATHYPAQRVRYLYEPIPGSLAGRHRGALEAQGDVCAFIDDDVQVNCDWLNGLEEAFRDPKVVLVGGAAHPKFESSPPDWLCGFYTENESGRSCGWLSLLDGGNSTKEIDPCYVWSLNLAIRKEILFKLGGFHPDLIPKPLQRFQGDGETGLGLNIARAGLKALYHPEVSVRHEVPASRLTAQYFAQRAFFQGVADSYTQVRAEGQSRQTKTWWPDSLRPIKRTFEFIRDAGRGMSTIRRQTVKAYNAGYKFHQDEVQRDPQLLEWVLQKDYWDYQLPKGWESFLPNVNSPHVSA